MKLNMGERISEIVTNFMANDPFKVLTACLSETEDNDRNVNVFGGSERNEDCKTQNEGEAQKSHVFIEECEHELPSCLKRVEMRFFSYFACFAVLLIVLNIHHICSFCTCLTMKMVGVRLMISSGVCVAAFILVVCSELSFRRISDNDEDESRESLRFLALDWRVSFLYAPMFLAFMTDSFVMLYHLSTHKDVDLVGPMCLTMLGDTTIALLFLYSMDYLIKKYSLRAFSGS